MNNPVSELAAEKKAQELIEKFMQYANYGKMEDDDYQLENAKQCAAICVQEIIDCTHSRDIVKSAILKGVVDKYCYEYWEKVLTEINKP